MFNTKSKDHVSLLSFKVLVLISMSLVPLMSFFVYGMRQGQFYYFALLYPVVTAPFIKETLLSPLFLFFNTSVQNQLTVDGYNYS